MRWLSLSLLFPLLIMLLITAGVSCGPDQPRPAQADGSREIASSSSVASPSRPINASAATPSNGGEPAPVPPKGAQYTIFCRDFSGPSHVDYANQAKNELLKNTKLRGWYVLHLEDHSSLMYGYYKSMDERAIKTDRTAIEQLGDSLGNRLFTSCIVMPIDAPDPTAPSEWNLAHLRRNDNDTDHFWSLQVAAYKDSPERKQAAIETVKAWRAQGIEAYYYHGPSISSVCVGCWPITAVHENATPVQGAAADDRVMMAPARIVRDPGQDQGQMPANMLREYKHQGVTVKQPELQVVDPKLRQAMQDYPQHFVNGVPEGTTVGDKQVPKSSFLVEIPAGTDSPFSVDAGRSAPPPTPDAVRALEPDSHSGTGTGRLKGVK